MRNRILPAIHDVFMAGFSFWLAFNLRYNFYYEPQDLLYFTALFAAVSAGVFFLLGVHRGVWQFASLGDIRNIVIASTVSMLAFLLIVFLLNRLTFIPRSVPIITWFVMIVLLSSSRALYRVYMTRQRQSAARTKLLIFGTASEADTVIRRFGLESSGTNHVIGIVDFDANSGGSKVRGTTILGDVAHVDEIVARLTREGRTPDALVIAEPREHRAALKKISEAGVTYGIPVRRVVEPTSLLDGGAAAPVLNALTLEDLLGRKPMRLELESIGQLIRGSTVLVTGAGGSIGSEITRQVASYRPERLVLVDHSELALYAIDHEIARDHPGLDRESIIASVRDRDLMFRLMGAAKPDVVFHAAALKHVPLIEANACEGALTNVIGTRSVADAAAANGARAVVMISTDKAIRPASVMGASKRAAEAYCQALDVSGTLTRFVTVRFGNVLGSSGSVVPLFERQIQAGGPVTVTHPDMRRYFMSIREATELVLQAAAFGLAHQERRGGILVLDMGDPVKIVDLARTMIAMAGRLPDVDVPIVFTGIRPGEKLFEELFDPDEANEPASSEGLIMAAPRLVDLDTLVPQIETLEQAAAKGDVAGVLAALRTIVTEYTPENGGEETAAPAETKAPLPVH